MSNWASICCNFCGDKKTGQVFISIKIDLPNPEVERKYQYTQTDLCKKCWEKLGIKEAFDKNMECKEIIS